MFWVAPLIGGAAGGMIYNMLFGAPGRVQAALEKEVRVPQAVS